MRRRANEGCLATEASVELIHEFVYVSVPAGGDSW